MEHSEEFNRVALWITWASEFMKLKQHPMSDQMTKVFLTCSMNEQVETFPGEELELSFQYRMAEIRAKSIDLQMTKAVKTFLSALCTSPGEVVMYLYAMKYCALYEKIDIVDMNAFSSMFKWGYPSQEDLSKIWDQQKGFKLGLKKVDNLLDTLREEDLHL